MRKIPSLVWQFLSFVVPFSSVFAFSRQAFRVIGQMDAIESTSLAVAAGGMFGGMCLYALRTWGLSRLGFGVPVRVTVRDSASKGRVLTCCAMTITNTTGSRPLELEFSLIVETHDGVIELWPSTAASGDIEVIARGVGAGFTRLLCNTLRLDPKHTAAGIMAFEVEARDAERIGNGPTPIMTLWVTDHLTTQEISMKWGRAYP